MPIYVDANVLLRYLLNDIPEQAEKAETILSQGAFVTSEVLAEVVFVLNGLYNMPRDEICGILTGLVNRVRCNKPDVLKTGLSIFGKSKLDFVDCILAAHHQVQGDAIATFDKDLLKALAKIDRAATSVNEELKTLGTKNQEPETKN